MAPGAPRGKRKEERVQWAAAPPIVTVIVIERNGEILRIGNQDLNMDEQDGKNALGGIIWMIELLDREPASWRGMQECGRGMPRPYE